MRYAAVVSASYIRRLPVAVGQDVLLLGDPLLGGLEATAAADLGLAALAEETGMGAVRRGATVTAHAHEVGAAGEHAFDGEFGPVAEGVTIFVEIATPAVIVLEQQLYRARYVHGAGSTGRQRAGKGHRRQSAHVADVIIFLCECQHSSAAVLAPQGRYVP